VTTSAWRLSCVMCGSSVLMVFQICPWWARRRGPHLPEAVAAVTSPRHYGWLRGSVGANTDALMMRVQLNFLPTLSGYRPADRLFSSFRIAARVALIPTSWAVKCSASLTALSSIRDAALVRRAHVDVSGTCGSQTSTTG